MAGPRPWPAARQDIVTSWNDWGTPRETS